MKTWKRVVALIALFAIVLSMAACQVPEMGSNENVRYNASKDPTRENTRKGIGQATYTDVVRLGSPIYVEDTVEYGWDAPKQACSVEDLIPAAVEAAGVVDGMRQIDAIRLINKYLYNTVAYSEGRYCRTAYGALYLKNSVCVGFTLAFMYMCHYCGIDAVYVHGRVGDTRHAWNGVYFSDGTYLEVDTCFNNTSADMERYLLLTPSEMTLVGGHVRYS